LKLAKRCLIALSAAVFLSGCWDRANVEDITLSMLVGMDLDEQNRLLFSLSSPVFSKEAKKKEEQYVMRSTSMRQSREEFDRTVVAMTMGGKVQALLLGKRVLQHTGWFELMDPFYRDNRNTVLPTVVLVDGPVSEVIQFSPEDKPRLPTYMRELVNTAKRRNITVQTTLQQLRRQIYEKGMTPSITELRKDTDLKVVGTALLRHDGRYAMTLEPHENKLCSLLRADRRGDFPFTIKLPTYPDDGVFQHNVTSFAPISTSVKTKTRYEANRFRFDVGLKMRIFLTEKLFPADLQKNAEKLERDIARKLENDYAKLIEKLQAEKVDPIGFGIHARARQYRHWKPVQNRWPEAFSKADVNVNVTIKIMGMGAIK